MYSFAVYAEYILLYPQEIVKSTKINVMPLLALTNRIKNVILVLNKGVVGTDFPIRVAKSTY